MKLVLFISLFFNFAFANVEIKDLRFKNTAHNGSVTIHFNGQLNDYPELKVVGQSIQVIIPQSKAKRVIEKSYSFSSKLKDTKIKIYQAGKNSTKMKALLPFNIEKKRDLVNLTIKDNTIQLSFPRIKVALKKNPSYIKTAKKRPLKKEFLNEAYLNNLLKVEKKDPVKNTVAKKNPVKKVDEVKTTQASPIRNGNNSNSSFSLIEMGGKMVAGVGLIVLLFYGVLVLMKKGFIKKGKLGFLNNAEQISVIGQNYIAPKKSLMLIKAHNQVFLVSNTEHGIHPISEIRDAAGLLKAGEKSISGTNFDANLDEATIDEAIETKVKLKDDITKSNQQSSLSSYMNVKDKVKFSDQIKKKVQSLKPLQ